MLIDFLLPHNAMQSGCCMVPTYYITKFTVASHSFPCDSMAFLFHLLHSLSIQQFDTGSASGLSNDLLQQPSSSTSADRSNLQQL